MRRLILALVGVFEVAVAIVLVSLAIQLPRDHEVRAQFGHARQVVGGTESQVRSMREQVADLRRQDLPQRSDQLRMHTKAVADTASQRQIDFVTVEAIARSLGDVSKGLNAWAGTVDAERMKRVSHGLGEAADFLDRSVADGADKSAMELEKALEGVEKDSARLAALLRQATPDLKAARAIHDGLAHFDLGLEKLDAILHPDRIASMKEGMVGLESSLNSTAEQVDKLSAYSYPVVTINGLKPQVENKPFWPDAEKVAVGLRKASKGATAANQELVVLDKSIPEIRTALAESRKSVAQTKASLAGVLKNQQETEKLLRTVPEQTATLAEALPKIARGLTAALRETKKLRDLAAGLRAVRLTLDDSLKNWPEVANGLKKSSVVLEDAQKQLNAATVHRAEYERAMASSAQAARSFAELLPAFTDQLDMRLSQQEASLAQMETGITEVSAKLPELEEKSSTMVRTVRVLLSLLSALVVIHAVYLLTDAIRPKRLGDLRIG